MTSDDWRRHEGGSYDLTDPRDLSLSLSLSETLSLLDGTGEDRRGRDGIVDAETRILLHDCVKTVDRIGRVGHGASRAVRLDQSVAALHHVAVASLLLGFVVSWRVSDLIVC